MKKAGIKERILLRIRIISGVKQGNVVMVTCGCCGGMSIRTLPELYRETVEENKSMQITKYRCLDCGAVGSMIEAWESSRG